VSGIPNHTGIPVVTGYSLRKEFIEMAKKKGALTTSHGKPVGNDMNTMTAGQL